MVVAAISPPPPIGDDVLVQRANGGDRPALDELFRRHRTAAFRVAYRLLGNEADALDAVQDGFVKALLNIGEFEGRSSFKTWLLRVISNASLDLGRKKGRRETLPYDPQSEEGNVRLHSWEDPASGLENADLRKMLDVALAQLPEPQRQAFVLHVEGDLSYREVAEIMGISIGTVMSRLFYARQKLKVILSPGENHE